MNKRVRVQRAVLNAVLGAVSIGLLSSACGNGDAVTSPNGPTSTAPVVTSVAPSSVLAGFPEAIVVNGLNFAQGLTVTIMATTAPTVSGPPKIGTISKITATSFEVTVTFPYSGGYSITVASGGQTSAPFGFQLSYRCPPTVYSLSGPTLVLVGESVDWTVGWEACPEPMAESGYAAALQSLNPTIAAVDSRYGQVMGISPGVAKIKWGYGTPSSGQQTVTVLESPPGPFTLRIDCSGCVVRRPGETQQLRAWAQFPGGSTIATHHSQWVSSNPNVATVVDGLVTARAAGSSQITATYNGVVSPAYTFNVQ